ncbi:MAG: hypothetical protein V4525_01305 [Pseudomonadota bacterium]
MKKKSANINKSAPLKGWYEGGVVSASVVLLSDLPGVRLNPDVLIVLTPDGDIIKLRHDMQGNVIVGVLELTQLGSLCFAML